MGQVAAVTGQRLPEDRFGVAAVDGNPHGLVVLIAVVVEHDQDFAQVGVDLEQARDVMRILQGHVRRQQRLRHAAAGVHRVEA